MGAIDPSLMEAAGFVGAQAQQAVGSANQRGAIQTNQLNMGGQQERQGITDQAESSGMLRSSRTQADLGMQSADQGNRQQLIDLGVSDTLAGANLDVMQALAKQQLQQEQAAQGRQLFDASMALQWQKFQQQAGQPIDYDETSRVTDGAVTGPNSNFYGGK